MQWAELMQRRFPELALLHHIPNGGSRGIREAANLKRAGVKPGVPDLCLPVARGGFHGLYIELKNETGRVSEEQKKWGEMLTEQRFVWAVCRGAGDAISIIETYLKGGASRGK